MPSGYIPDGMFHFLYCTINKVNGMIYVGKHSTDDLNDGYLGSGKLLTEAISKFGRKNFERHIIRMCESSEEAYALEAYVVDSEVISDENTYNITLGGTGFSPETALKGTYASHKVNWSNPEFRERTRQRVSELGKKTGPATFRRLHAEGKMKAPDWTGRNHSEETKRKIGIANSFQQRGEKNSQFGTSWIHHPELNQVKKVKKEELDKWLEQGWLKGRKIASCQSKKPR